MSGVVAIVDWNHPTIHDGFVHRMLACVPHRSTDGCEVLCGEHCSMGFARHATTAREREEKLPLHDTERGVWIVADTRLDNRDELRESLQGAGGRAVPNSELLVLGYERWGTGLAERLIGDFAFVIWDSKRRRLYAARDPFGVRPLYYHSSSRRLILASEIEQLLAVEGVGREIEDHLVLDYLLWNIRHHHETFFREIFRALPGHYLLAEKGDLRQVRYWYPPQREVHLARAEEYSEEFRRLFRLAVETRLDSDFPLVAQLSGGLDSSSIVCMADDIYGRSGDGRPPLHLCSAVFPGLDCDETPFVDAVAQRVRFPLESWNGKVSEWPDSDKSTLAYPSPDVMSASFSRIWRIALREGARVILSGEGGDQLLFERGVFRDLAAHGRWLRLMREVLAPSGFYSGRPPSFFLKDAFRGIAPRFLRRAYRRLRPRRPEPPPGWLGPRLREIWSDVSNSPQESAPIACTSHTQRCNWIWLTDAHPCWHMEMQELEAASHGLQIRFPFLDKRLVCFVLAVPFKYRLPGGKMKILLRRAMEDLLPLEVAHRQEATAYDSNVRFQVAQHLPRIRAICHDDTWVCAPYVLQGGVQNLLEELDAGSTGTSNSQAWRRVWDIAMLELWLRDLLKY